MRWTCKKFLNSKGYVEVLLLLLLSILLICAHSLLERAHLIFLEEKYSNEILNKKNLHQLESFKTLSNDSSFLKTPVKQIINTIPVRSLSNNYLIASIPEYKKVNWSLIGTLKSLEDICPNLTCYFYKLDIRSGIRSEKTIEIDNLSISLESKEPIILASLKEIYIKKLNLVNSSNKSPKLVLIAAWQEILIEEISTNYSNNLILLIHSSQGKVEVKSLNKLEPCSSTNDKGIVIQGKEIIINGLQHISTEEDDHNCLKLFPKELFTNIKLVAIE